MTHTLSLLPAAAVPEPVPEMLGAQEYLRVEDSLLAGGRDRPAFSTQVKNDIPANRGQARCHYISYNLIARCITAILNGVISSTAAIHLLYNLHSGMFCFSTGNDTAKADANRSIAALLGIHPATAGLFLPEAAKLLVSLNSSVANLRTRNQDWNASIGEQYDPAYWWCAVSAREYRDRTGEVKELSSGMADLKPGEFYLRTSDKLRPSYLTPLAGLLSPVGFFSATDESGIPFVYSSNNQFSLPEETDEYQGAINFIADGCFAD